MNFLKLIPDTFRNAAILAVSRHIVSSLAGALAVYLLANHATESQTTEITGAVTTLLLALTSYGTSLLDVKNVDKKIQVALETPVSVPVVQPIQPDLLIDWKKPIFTDQNDPFKRHH